MSDTPITDAHKGYLSEYGCFLRDPRFGHIVQVGLSRDLERVARQMAEALADSADAWGDVATSPELDEAQRGFAAQCRDAALKTLAAWRAF